MIKCENLTDEDLNRIGAYIAGAFRAERGAFQVLEKDSCEKMFSIIVKTCYETGHLYKTSENEEGFCVYWTKKERPGAWVQIKMMFRTTFALPLKAGLAFMKTQQGWTPTEKRYAKAKDFVEIFLIAVRPEYQGKGYFKAMLQEPFELAKSRDTICVLDTDSETKASKYAHEGMHIVDRKKLKSGYEMFAMEK